MVTHIIDIVEKMRNVQAAPKLLYIGKQADEYLKKQMPDDYTTDDDGNRILTINGVALRVFVLPCVFGYNAYLTQDEVVRHDD